jgi:hypothetical protein
LKTRCKKTSSWLSGFKRWRQSAHREGDTGAML